MSHLTESSPYAVLEYLQTMSAPVKVLKVVNLAPAARWEFEVGVNAQHIPQVEIKYPNSISPKVFESDLVPEIWFGFPRVYPEQGIVRLTDFAGKVLDPSLSDREGLRRVLSDDTWLGGQAFRDSAARVIIRVLTQTFSFAPADCQSRVQVGDEIKLMVGELSLILSAIPNSHKLVIRDAFFGYEVPSGLKVFAEQFRAVGFKAGQVEFGPGWLKMGPMGLLQLTAEAQWAIEHVDMDTEWGRELKALNQRIRKNELEAAAARLNQRKYNVSCANRVLLGAKQIGTVPTSEAGTVALIHKIEALEGFPVEHFVSRGWAGVDGVDAIGDFQIDSVHTMQHQVAIEYEFHFSSFLKHEHPHEHVGLVVCWDVDRTDLVKTDQPWLYYLDDGEHRIPVLAVKDFPKIHITKVGTNE